MPADEPPPDPNATAAITPSSGAPSGLTPEAVTSAGEPGAGTASHAHDPGTTAAAPDRDSQSGADAEHTGSMTDPAATTGGLADGTPPVCTQRYELGAEIARGGMGVVYRATDTAFGREVAVKVLHDKYAPDSFTARRFADEARITGQLQHPGIPPAHDLGTLPDGRPFLAMKLIKGQTLDDLLKSRPDPAADRGRLVAAFEQICQAVAYAHAHNVLHRDLKPANVMVGGYGEVQVMDWGLAKVLTAGGPPADPTDPQATTDPDPTAVKSLRDAELFTQYGSILGTPAYMAPEQAIGAIDQIDARSDVFGLGGILAAILTGRPPFIGVTSENTRQMAAKGKLDDCFTRLDASGAEPDLVALCKNCLAAEKEDRPADAKAVAEEVATLRSAADQRARQAELETVRVAGERQKAVVQAAEQRKRRRVQLALAGVVLVVAVGGGVATFTVQQDKFAAEQKRQDELRDAETAANQQQKQTKAAALAHALATAEPGAVPVLLKELADFREETRPHVRELASLPIEQRAGLHGRLAILADRATADAERSRTKEQLVGYFLRCRGDELALLIDNLADGMSANNVDALWTLFADFPMGEGLAVRHVRRAALMARLDPENPRWAGYAEDIIPQLVRMNPLLVEPFADALRPVRNRLVPALLKQYPELRGRIESGKLPTTQLVSEASAFDLTANLLARYAADIPNELAEFALTLDARHYPLFADAISKNKAEVVLLLKAELNRRTAPRWAVNGGGVPLAAAAGCAVAADPLDPDPVIQAEVKRQGYAAAVLVALGEGDAVWPLFAFPKDGDPTARSYLVQRLAAVGADPLALMTRFVAETDVSAKRAVLLALGDFPLDLVDGAKREAFAGALLKLYREHPDSGLHSAIEWLLGQKWGKADELAVIDAELAATTRAAVVARGLVDLATAPLRVGSLLPAPAVARAKDWFVSGEGQTFAVVRGPVEFTLGSPLTEPRRTAVNETRHRNRISRTFAVATREVTNAEFLRFRPKHTWAERYSPGVNTPVVEVTWYDAAAYCNWLSEREGIPESQWCYAPAKGGGYGEGMWVKAGHLKLTGYRLPTEAEWEFACRARSVTARTYGRGDELLSRHGWFAKTSDDCAQPVAALRPNDLGLFDTLGNVWEWCGSPEPDSRSGLLEELDDSVAVAIDELTARMVRGGSFIDLAEYLRSANRVQNRPGWLDSYNGFRPVRTLPDK